MSKSDQSRPAKRPEHGDKAPKRQPRPVLRRLRKNTINNIIKEHE